MGNQQVGSILVLTLVLLLFLQIVATTIINSNHINHHIVSNFSLKNTLEKTANKVVGDFIRNKDYFLNYKNYLDASSQFKLNAPIELGGISIKLAEFYCLDNVTRKKSYICDTSSEFWQLKLIVSDKKATVFISFIQGLKLIQKTAETGAQKDDFRLEKLWWLRS